MSSSSTHRGSMFVPRSTGGRWILLIIAIFLIWLTVQHPSDAVDLFRDFTGAIGTAFSSIFDAYKEARTR